MPAFSWNEKTTVKDVEDAQRFLSMLMRASELKRIGDKWLSEDVLTGTREAKDILRACGLPLLAKEDPHVTKWTKRMDAGEKLGPILLICGNLWLLRPPTLAEGYGRTCAAMHKGADTPVQFRQVE